MNFDYVIVGAGSAGCVLANRLSADPATSVCLVEAGGSDKSSFIYTPTGITVAITTRLFNWYYHTKAQPTLHNREIFCPRGKVLGGSSSINAMLYVRGQPGDYDHWAALGNSGWRFQDVLPYFKKAQHQERGADALHGVGGPLNVADLRHQHPLSKAFVAAAVEAGYPFNPDFNGPEQEGVGYFQVTQKDGQRCSAAAAYLHPVMDRPNLTVITKAHTQRILLDGKRARGIEIVHGGQRRTLRADKEVMLCAGAFGSPQLLLLSGIGAAAKLQPHGIPVRHELAGVGENLQEHVDVMAVLRDKSATAISYRPKASLKNMLEMVKYLRHRQGLLTSPLAEAGAFIKSAEAEATPDIQLHFLPSAMDDHGRNLAFYFKYGLSLHVCLLRPKSRGSVSLASAAAADDPVIDLNLLSHKDDLAALRNGFKRARSILRSPALADSAGAEIFPGDPVQEDAELDDYIRRKANHIYHPVGTCKMGSDPQAVVDAELRVHGLEGLRVVDASVMPTVVSGNTNAPTIMIGEKAADMILQQQARHPLAQEVVTA
ncbi:choline dehydrogenase [Exilibacterium tricleocarpae]|uniref:Choline dehydrogenase n=1 Tax=Exilibacterium tricleocarpae TaxID=2591008 RepID=A0A545TFD9_9GAMM|nr:choline dehydrogenase [Exilibacterium tricleocarpae]TQV75930.1 choline dehydrogenase [Exilibacterium tricleocarpae]